tara:strand:+ start:557 stop:721 length:165 start_codon:yes stop_codon:yes gene_type:complete
MHSLAKNLQVSRISASKKPEASSKIKLQNLAQFHENTQKTEPTSRKSFIEMRAY